MLGTMNRDMDVYNAWDKVSAKPQNKVQQAGNTDGNDTFKRPSAVKKPEFKEDKVQGSSPKMKKREESKEGEVKPEKVTQEEQLEKVKSENLSDPKEYYPPEDQPSDGSEDYGVNKDLNI